MSKQFLCTKNVSRKKDMPKENGNKYVARKYWMTAYFRIHFQGQKHSCPGMPGIGFMYYKTFPE